MKDPLDHIADPEPEPEEAPRWKRIEFGKREKAAELPEWWGRPELLPKKPPGHERKKR